MCPACTLLPLPTLHLQPVQEQGLTEGRSERGKPPIGPTHSHENQQVLF